MFKLSSVCFRVAFACLVVHSVGCSGAAQDDEDADASEEVEPIGTTSAALTGTAGKLNLWDDRNYTDTHIARTSYDSDLGNDGFNDKASSVINRTGYYWKLYDNKDYGGQAICIRPRSHVANLGACAGITCMLWNDRISSVRRLASSASCNGIVGDPN